MSNADFKPKFIAWDEDAFRADRDVARMTPLQRAFCRSLVIESYYNAERPWLPVDDEKLWRLADASSLDEWLSNRDAVLVKFTRVDIDGMPLLQNKRCMEEWQVMAERLEQKRSAGAASAKARWGRGKKPKAAVPKNTEHNKTPHHHTLERYNERDNERYNDRYNERDVLKALGVVFFNTTGKSMERTTGSKAVNEIVRKDGEAQVLAVFKHWLTDRNVEGMKCPLHCFAEEYKMSKAVTDAAKKSAADDEELRIRMNKQIAERDAADEIDRKKREADEAEQERLAAESDIDEFGVSRQPVRVACSA